RWPWYPLKYTFRMCRDEAMTTGCVESAKTTAPTWSPPTMNWGSTYWWTATVWEGDPTPDDPADDSHVSDSMPTPVSLVATVPQEPPLHYGADPYGSDHDGVNMAVGNYSRTVSDLNVAGVGPALAVTRTYNSLDTSSRWFGTGWTGPWDST